MRIYPDYIKRILDLLISVPVFIIFLPVMAALALIVYLSTHINPFFFQLRPGKNGKVFRLVKFKTMNDKRDAGGNLLPDEVRLTALGKLMRKTSLDELPQLANVIMGHMSLVGPRPLLVAYLERYSERQARRHEVRPGVTGWAQVNGRNAISWEEKFEFDVWYVDNISFLLDLKIIWFTIRKLFRKEGVSNREHAIMPYFKGADSA